MLLLLLFPLMGIGVAIAMMAANNNSPTGALPAVNQSAPRLLNWSAPDVTLIDYQSYNKVKISDFRGRPVFLNFWATWCEPCQREMPAFEKFLARQGKNGAAVLTINSTDTPADIQKFITTYNAPHVPVALDTEGSAWKNYNIVNLPTTYLVDPQGTVRYMKLGEVTVDDLSGYLKALADSATPQSQ